MRTWKRGSLDIIAEILESLQEKSLKKSHISNKCNLDARLVNKYLEIIIQLNLVEKSKTLQRFKITQYGINFLEKYILLTNFLDELPSKNREIKQKIVQKEKLTK